eukprot:1578171-Pyramimonas_sp.AAC.1
MTNQGQQPSFHPIGCCLLVVVYPGVLYSTQKRASVPNAQRDGTDPRTWAGPERWLFWNFRRRWTEL